MKDSLFSSPSVCDACGLLKEIGKAHRHLAMEGWPSLWRICMSQLHCGMRKECCSNRRITWGRGAIPLQLLLVILVTSKQLGFGSFFLTREKVIITSLYKWADKQSTKCITAPACWHMSQCSNSYMQTLRGPLTGKCKQRETKFLPFHAWEQLSEGLHRIASWTILTKLSISKSTISMYQCLINYTVTSGLLSRVKGSGESSRCHL